MNRWRWMIHALWVLHFDVLGENWPPCACAHPGISLQPYPSRSDPEGALCERTKTPVYVFAPAEHPDVPGPRMPLTLHGSLIDRVKHEVADLEAPVVAALGLARSKPTSTTFRHDADRNDLCSHRLRRFGKSNRPVCRPRPIIQSYPSADLLHRKRSTRRSLF